MILKGKRAIAPDSAACIKRQVIPVDGGLSM
jgi:hypothetical protein